VTELSSLRVYKARFLTAEIYLSIFLSGSGYLALEVDPTVAVDGAAIFPMRSAILPVRSAIFPARSAILPARSVIFPARSSILPARSSDPGLILA